MNASIIVTAISMCFFEGESVLPDLVRREAVCVCDAEDWGEGDCEDWGLPMVAMNGGAE